PCCTRGTRNPFFLVPLVLLVFLPLFPFLEVQLPLIQAAGPILLQQTREGAIRKEAAFCLACGAVVTLVFGINNPLHRCSAYWTRLAEAAVNGHLRPEGRDFGRELLSCIFLQSFDPFDKC